jgi:hypothetical protein
MQTCWIIGGGCYGSSYLRQFRKAALRGKMPKTRWVVLDRNPDCQATLEIGPEDPLEFIFGEWEDILLQSFSNNKIKQNDLIIPSPFQGPLIFNWLKKEADLVDRVMLPIQLPEIGGGLLYEKLGADKLTRYSSFADWVCPPFCIEPQICPVTKGLKSWDMRDLISNYAVEKNIMKTYFFVCLHWIYGVGGMPADAFLKARSFVREGPPGDFLISSMSTCHGATSAWNLSNNCN